MESTPRVGVWSIFEGKGGSRLPNTVSEPVVWFGCQVVFDVGADLVGDGPVGLGRGSFTYASDQPRRVRSGLAPKAELLSRSEISTALRELTSPGSAY